MLTIPQEVKDLLHLDSCKKNIRIHFPNGERSDICNNLIVKNSVSFKESLCSQDTLKFGLCESPVFECETVGVGNVKGAIISVFCEIYCDRTVENAVWKSDLQAYVYQIPYGVFVIDSCARQADLNHRRIIAYNNIYNSMTYNANNSIIAFWAGAVRPSDSPLSINVEDMIFSTYPKLFDISLYDYSVYDLNTDPGFVTRYDEDTIIYTKANAGITYNVHVSHSLKEISSRSYIRKIDFSTFKQNTAFDTELDAAFEAAALVVGALPGELREAANNYIYKKACVVASRDDRLVSPSADVTVTKAFSGDMYLLFPAFDSYLQYAEIHYTDVKISVTKTVSGTTTTEYESIIHRYANGTVLIYSVESSEVPRTTVQLIREADQYALLGSFAIAGYSARKAYEALNILDITSAFFESKGVFASFTRSNGCKLINIKKQFFLVPENELYPNSSLYPQRTTGGSIFPNNYQYCWYNDSRTKPFGAVRCDYKNTNNENASLVYFLPGFTKDTPTTDYSTYHIQNSAFLNLALWTQSQIRSICETIAGNIQGVAYMPLELKGRGLPYVEAGDTFEILTKSNESITTIVLNRTLTGELTLTDSYKSNGTGFQQ